MIEKLIDETVGIQLDQEPIDRLPQATGKHIRVQPPKPREVRIESLRQGAAKLLSRAQRRAARTLADKAEVPVPPKQLQVNSTG